MLKHIVVLALCFVAYIIGNLDERKPADRKAEFDRLVDCYDQMVQQKIVIIQKDGYFTFKALMSIFFKDIKVKTTDDENGKTLTDVESPQFLNDEQFNALKNTFIPKFVQIPTDPEKIKAALALMTLSGSSNYPEPLNTFIKHYNIDSEKDYFKSVSAFCSEYSSNPGIIKTQTEKNLQ